MFYSAWLTNFLKSIFLNVSANWENEFRRWCPSIGFQVYHGTLEERREMRYFWNKEGFGDTEVILSTYV